MFTVKLIDTIKLLGVAIAAAEKKLLIALPVVDLYHYCFCTVPL